MAPLLLAACGQDESFNMMAPDANALSPAQIDLALGPEPGNASGDRQAGPAPEAVALQPEQPAGTAVAPQQDPQPEVEPEPEPEAEVEAEEGPTEPPPEDNSVTEE